MDQMGMGVGMMIPVTETMDGKCWIAFREEDIRRACEIAGCEEEMIEECMKNMKNRQGGCLTCYAILMGELRAVFTFMEKQGGNPCGD
ncbi:MAG: hypothetical protein ACTSUS_07875 [Candidatus Freyarchaeota archaeon]